MRTFADKIFFVLLATVLCLTGCSKEYEDRYENLELDYTRFNLAMEGGEFAFMVYYSGDWTITLDKDVAWARLEKTSGSGITPVHIAFDENYTFQRSFTMTISGGGESKDIVVTQKPAVTNPIFRFVEESITLCNGAYHVKTRMQSNLSEVAIQSNSPTVEYDAGGEGWIGDNFAMSLLSDDFVVEDGTAVYTYVMTFDIMDNQTGNERLATLNYRMYDEEGQSYGTSVPVRQTAQEGQLLIAEETVRGCRGKEYSEAVSGGLERFDEDITWDITYADGASEFISGVKMADSRLYYTLSENTESTLRQAHLTLKYKGEEGPTLKVVQREAGVNAIYEISTAEQLLAWNRDGANWAADDLVILNDDIDCAGVVNSENWKMNNFTGRFVGNGRTISSFVIEKAGAAAFFNNISGKAKVTDLSFSDDCSVTATAKSGNRVYAGGLAIIVKDEASLENITFRGSVTATDAAIGASNGNYIAGICASLESTGLIRNCVNHADVTFAALPSSWVNVAGLFGQVTPAVEIIGCENHGKVEFKGSDNASKSINLGAITGGANTASFTDCRNLGSVVCNAAAISGGLVNIGGMVAYNNSDVLGAFTRCSNGSDTDAGQGTLMNNSPLKGRLSIGGCIGYINQKDTDVSGFKNYGSIINRGGTSTGVALGGVVGRILAVKSTGDNSITDCENHGDVMIDAASANDGTYATGIGGILGLHTGVSYEYGEKKSVAHYGCRITVSGCSNSGEVRKSGAGSNSVHVGGIIGTLNSAKESGTTNDVTGIILNCSNTGNVSNESTGSGSWWNYTGGVVGYHRGTLGSIEGCTNAAAVINKASATSGWDKIRLGGIAGGADIPSMKDCTNSGAVRDESQSAGGCVGGVVGCAKYSGIVMDNCDNTANVSGMFENAGDVSNIHVGGVAGYAAKPQMTGCDDTGTVSKPENN